MVKKMLMALFYVDEADNTKDTILIADKDMFGTDELKKEVSRQVKAYLRVTLNDDDLCQLLNGETLRVKDCFFGDNAGDDEYSLGWEEIPSILHYNEE